MLRFVCPTCTRETDGIAAKLWRCGIGSETLVVLLSVKLATNREVLNGVGVDGVGVRFPIFPVNYSCLLLS